MRQKIVGTDDRRAAPVQQPGQVLVQALGQPVLIPAQLPLGGQFVVPQGAEKGGVADLVDVGTQGGAEVADLPVAQLHGQGDDVHLVARRLRQLAEPGDHLPAEVSGHEALDT